MVTVVSRAIPLETLELPDEFYPAHLSVALVDAVFRSRIQNEVQVTHATERYCRRFGIARRRAEQWDLPSIDRQETLRDLIRHYDELGLDRMTNEVFRTGQRVPGTTTTRAEYVLRAAMALRNIGVEILQDVTTRPPEEIEDILRYPHRVDEHTIRMLLMYAGDDDFVRGDVHIREFVAHAIGRKNVSAATAEDLVRQSAYELILSPRYLDYAIWRRNLAS